MMNNSPGALDTAISYFGKLPFHADFIRHNASGEDMRALDLWIQQGLYQAAKHYSQNWDSMYKNSPAYHFLFNPEDSDFLLIGLYKPSYDKSQRKYPFTIAKRITQRHFDTKFLHILPILFGDFFRQSLQIFQEDSQGLGADVLRERVVNMRGISDEDWEVSTASFEHYLSTTEMERFLIRLLGDFENQRKFLMMKNLFEVLSPFQSRRHIHIPLGLRFPLSQNTAAIEHEVCFWISLCYRILGSHSVIPNVFWPIQDSSNANYLFVYFRKPTWKTFLQLLGPRADFDSVCKLEEDGADNPAYFTQDIRPDFRSALEDKGLTLRGLLDRFQM